MPCLEALVLLTFILILHESLSSSVLSLKTSHPFVSGYQEKFVPHTCLQTLEDKSADCQFRHLTEVPHDLYKDIQKLNLSGNYLTALHNTSVQQYSQLIEVDLSRNHIHNIEGGTFYPLPHLKNLILSRIPNLKFSAEIFKCSVELRVLDLRLSRLMSFPTGIMKFLPNLVYLYIGENELRSINITLCSSNNIHSIDFFRNTITKLSHDGFLFRCPADSLSVYGNPVEVIDPKTIASLPIRVLSLGGHFLSEESLGNLLLGVSSSVIEELLIEDANISYIPSDLFAPLNNKSLSKLSLIGNSLVLYYCVFADLTHVSALHLGNCHLQRLEPNFFDGMTRLSYLNLDSNSLTDLNPSGMMWKVNLYELHLSHNEFREINGFAFSGLYNLTTLIINNIDFPGGATQLYISVDTLQSLRISGNVVLSSLNTPILKYLYCGNRDIYSKWSCIYKGTFEDALALEGIDMSNAGLSDLTTWETLPLQVHVVSLFHRLHNLTFLNISGNFLENIPSGIFTNSTSLQDLKIRDNFIKVISSNAFVGLVSLQTLDLSGNHILYISAKFLRDLRELQNFHIDSNSLSYLDEDLFAASPVLANVTLTNNRLVSLNRSTFRQIYSSLKYVDISGNVLMCNCDGRWMIDELLQFLHHGDITFCSMASATLEPLKDKPLTLFKPSAYCHTNIAPYFFIIPAVFLLTVTCVLSYHHRWLLRYKIFLLKLAILGYREIQDAHDKEDFEYDLNLMFVVDDKEWAEENLRPALEERLPNFGRIAFGDDELITGMYYLDAVCYNVEKSFKTVLLFSRAAVHDHIFMTKFRIAMNHVTDTKTENTILVFLEDIPDEELPYLVRLYLSGQGAYLSWEEDEEGQEYFWNKFTKDLTVNLKINHLVPPE